MGINYRNTPVGLIKP